MAATGDHSVAAHTRLKIWYNPGIIRQYIHSKTDENHVLFSFLLYILHQFGILDDICVITKIFLSLKSENPATCLCTIALFRCVRPALMRTLREVRVLESV